MGDNATGKSTLFDALTWLITDKDSHGRSTGYFSIKTKENGEVIPDIEHSVEGVFDEITLQKVYTENWVTKRGSQQAQLDGHTTKHFVDEVPCSMSEYQEAIDEIMDGEQFKILSNPMYFPEELHWGDRRTVLLDLCGDVEQADIVGGNEALGEYPSVLDGKTRDQREKILKEHKKKLDNELDNIPSRIDELNGRLYEVEGVDKAKDTLKDLKRKKEAIEAKRSEVKSGGGVADLKVEKQELEAQKATLSNEHEKGNAESLKELRQKVSERQNGLDEIENEFREARRTYEKAESEAKNIKQSKELLEDKLEVAKAKKPHEDTGPDVCPVCERPMEEDSEHDYQDYVEEFNADKAETIKGLKEELQAVSKHLNDARASMDSAERNAANIEGKKKQRQAALAKVNALLKESKDSQPAFGDSKEYEDIASKIEVVATKISDYKSEKESQLIRLDEEIETLEAQMGEATQTIHQANENKRTRKRINELQEEQQKFSKQLEEVEHQLYVIEQFVLEESRHITRKVNDLFDIVEWKLFEEQLNGGIKQVCEPLVDGIPFGGGLNTGGRIAAGLDIINTLSAHYGKSAPCVFDNAEAVTSLPETDIQIIALYVSEEDEEMRIEQGLPKHELKQESEAAA